MKLLSAFAAVLILLLWPCIAIAQGGGGENTNKKLPKKETENSSSVKKAPSETSKRENNNSDRVTWVRIESGQSVPSNAIVGGVEVGGQNNGAMLYVCRAEYNGGVHPGKLIGGFCNISFAGQEIVLSNYQ